MTSYLRLRLAKIQSQIWALDESLLSREEVAFARSHRAALESHFDELVFKQMPGNFGRMPKAGGSSSSGIDSGAALPNGNLDCTVFVRAVDNVEEVVLEDSAAPDKYQVRSCGYYYAVF